MEIGWIDYSEEARQRTLTVLAALHEKTAIDELGFGIIRDAFANFFFPTTSTLFTRAKYFFFVPYALCDMERENNSGNSSSQLRKRYDEREMKLACELIDANSEDTSGIIGSRSLGSDHSGHWVKRGPAAIYWAALRNLGFCRNPNLSLDEYFRAIAGREGTVRHLSAEQDTNASWNDDDSPSSSLWHIPRDSYLSWNEDRTMALQADEAKFLAQQLEIKFPNSLYSLMMRDERISSAAMSTFRPSKTNDAEEDVISVGERFSQFAEAVQTFVDEETGAKLRSAIAFSDFIYVCRTRYNAQLPTIAEEAEAEWASLESHAADYANNLDIDWLYLHMNIDQHSGSERLRSFLTEARDYMLKKDVTALDSCIKDRERSIKHDRAKIGRPGSVPGNWRGGRRLSYRYEVAASFAADVLCAGDEYV